MTSSGLHLKRINGHPHTRSNSEYSYQKYFQNRFIRS